jgi:hypothetical protein|tara:strand:- start:86 stop:469 length:384 start_codon:yes stop_codon:yes gene_type:complete
MAQVKKRSVGRPKTNLDLADLEKICRLNCTMPEIAAFFDIPLRTLEDKYTNDEAVRRSIDKGRNQGKLSLRRKQLQILDETNNPTMAIWLGKQLLGQRDKHDIVTEDKSTTRLTDALNIVEKLAKNK